MSYHHPEYRPVVVERQVRPLAIFFGIFVGIIAGYIWYMGVEASFWVAVAFGAGIACIIFAIFLERKVEVQRDPQQPQYDNHRVVHDSVPPPTTPQQ